MIEEALVFDCETDGLLDELTTVHCISLQRVSLSGETLGPVLTADDHTGELSIAQALEMLQAAPVVVGHNIIDFDIPALAKVFPGFRVKRAFDTLLLSTLIWPNLRDRDFDRNRKVMGAIPGQMIGRHSLEAWGYRLGKWKGDYSANMKAQGLDPWASWNQEMSDYCDQDVVVTTALFALQMSKGLSQDAIDLEHSIAPILARQTRYGFLFNQQKADKLEMELLLAKQRLTDQLRQVFLPWEEFGPEKIAKRNDRSRGRVKGEPYRNVKKFVFNPGSRDHIAKRLKALYGWKPSVFTPEGKPKIDEDTLSPLKYPEIPLLLQYLTVSKRFGQLASPPPKRLKNGELSKAKKKSEAWRDHVKADGRVHGKVNQNAAVTGRMTHANPNMAQVPKVQKDKTGILHGLPGGWGYECRELFYVPKGKKLVGADASGLELRCLAHFMALYDGGAYAKVLLEGDIHAANQEAAGLPTRDNAKTFIYAFLYGAGDEKIGSIIGKGRKHGRALKEKFLNGLPALKRLVTGVKKRAKQRGYLRGLDGRRLHIRSDHAALNTLLQSAGALVMKKALSILDQTLQEKYGLVPGVNYEFVGNIHDEWQIEVDEEFAELVGQTAVASIAAAGDAFGFKCKLDGEYKVGNNWAETH